MKNLVIFILFYALFFYVSPLYGNTLFDSDYEVHGMFEIRAGFRTVNDNNHDSKSVGDLRFRPEFELYTDNFDAKFTPDFYYDNIKEKSEFKAREAWVFLRPFSNIDIKAGRQILTWGTGDLVFLNDLFPKDWQSFFIGRNDEYLKAPSDSLKISMFSKIFNIDFIYNPVFEPDRFINGTYISYWNEPQNDFAGHSSFPKTNKPDNFFDDDEIHLRIYKNINNYEFAFYGYSGFWKSPSGQNKSGGNIFTRMDSGGASIRGALGLGIANFEISYYHSNDDQNGNNPEIKNSELRYLAGYSFDPAKDFNINLQYYMEQICNYGNYKENLNAGADKKDRLRSLFTISAVKSLMNQNLKVIFSGYYSPTDEDFYLRPKLNYQISDSLIAETGANIFGGNKNSTFFTQFKNNTNIYFALSAYF